MPLKMISLQKRRRKKFLKVKEKLQMADLKKISRVRKREKLKNLKLINVK
jgi:hypothetical protein